MSFQTKEEVLEYIKSTTDENILKSNTAVQLRFMYQLLYTMPPPASLTRKPEILKALRYIVRMLSQNEAYKNIKV